jgi:hypothetical protein
MDDPTLDSRPEMTDADVLAELERMRAEFYAHWGTNIHGACEEGARKARALGMRLVDSEDDPMHPKNVNRHARQIGIV